MTDSRQGSEFLTRHGVTPEVWRACVNAAQLAAARLRLTFAREIRGLSGSMSGAGSGVSIDFKDHRRYLPGDDPRHINWQAYARTGNPVLKVFHEEVSPKTDLVVDLSASHAHEREKLETTLRIALFAAFSARKRGSSAHVHLTRGDKFLTLEPAAFLSGRWEPPAAGETEATVPVWHRIPWRAKALRVIVSDLLFPGEPELFLAPLSREGARTLLLCPHSKAESDPDWSGHVTLTDCETGEKRERRGGEALKSAYAEAYRRHFILWDEAARRRSATLARIPCSENLAASLLGDALRTGAVEPA